MQKWSGFEENLIKKIISNEFEIDFLIKLKKNIEFYFNNVFCLIKVDDRMASPKALTKYYNEVINDEFLYYLGFTDPDQQDYEQYEEDTPEIDRRFNYDLMKVESDKLPENYQKINFINKRLSELEQWQLKYDVEESYGDPVKIRMFYTCKYYPLFERQCQIELKRLKSLKSQENELALVQKNIIQSPSFPLPFIWIAKDTQLLELVTAIYKADSIAKKDESSINRKELIEFFAQIFNIEIKDIESKLSRATGRNDDTPYLDKLKRAFKEYILEKKEKLTARQ